MNIPVEVKAAYKALNKIKFWHVILVILLYMGINISVKINMIKEISTNGKTEAEVEIIDTFDFDGKVFEFYSNGTIMLNGYEIQRDTGFYNDDKTRHIYINKWHKRIIKQNDEILEPIFKVESNKFKNIYVYEFDVNAEIYGKEIDKENDIDITSSVNEGKNLSIDFNKLEQMVHSWRKMGIDEKFVYKLKKHDLLQIDYNWHEYQFIHCNFSPYSISFDLYDNEKIIIHAYGNNYELTQSQYDEFIDFIKSCSQ